MWFVGGFAEAHRLFASVMGSLDYHLGSLDGVGIPMEDCSFLHILLHNDVAIGL